MDSKSTNKNINAASMPTACGSNSAIDDIIKMGIMRKGDKGLKRFFVLRQDRYASPASLEYYENEKKFRQGYSPKLHLKLKEVFNVNKTIHAKIKFCIGIFTLNETLYVGCDKEDELDTWFNSIFSVYMGTKKGTPEEISRQNFDHVWDVSIAKVQGFKITGAYRLCLNNDSLYLYKTASDEERIDIPLVYISNFGHSNDKLCIRTGRLYHTGAGEIWFHTLDPSGAQNIHEVLKNIVDENHAMKTRSSSAGSDSFRSCGSVRHSRANSTTNVGTWDRTISTAGSSNLVPESRIRAISENEKSLIGWRNQRQSHGVGMDGHASSVAHMAGLGPFVVTPSASNRPSSASQSPSSNQNVLARFSASVHQGMNFSSGDGSSSSLATNDLSSRYLAEKAGDALPVVEENADSAYLHMHPGISPKTESTDGYLPMSGSNTRLSQSRQTSWHLEEVRSYITDPDNDSLCSSTAAPPHSRAYSLGSKPLTNIGPNTTSANPALKQTSSPRSELVSDLLSEADDRRRAHSFGSTWNQRETKRNVLVPPQMMDRSDNGLHQSDSFGSGRSTPKSRRFTDSSKRSNHSDDLVEMVFTPTSIGRSPSGSFGSNDSLHRPRTNSYMGSLIGKNGWAPTVDQISEVTSDTGSGSYQTPSSMVIQQSLQNSRNALSSEPSTYIMMGGPDESNTSNNPSTNIPVSSGTSVQRDRPVPKQAALSSDYALMGAAGAGPEKAPGDYLMMNVEGHSGNNKAASTAPVSATETNSAASSTAGTTPDSFQTPPKRCSDDELLRRLARVEMAAGEPSTSKMKSGNCDDYIAMDAPRTAASSKLSPKSTTSKSSPSSRPFFNSSENLRVEILAENERNRRQKSASPTRSPIFQKMLSSLATTKNAALVQKRGGPEIQKRGGPENQKGDGPEIPIDKSSSNKVTWSSMAGLPRQKTPAIPTTNHNSLAEYSAAVGPTSLPSERELNGAVNRTGALEYATLDVNKSPIFTRSPKTTTTTTTPSSASADHEIRSEKEKPTILYAKIDITKSEGLKKKLAANDGLKT